jgi:hypothetical protein
MKKNKKNSSRNLRQVQMAERRERWQVKAGLVLIGLTIFCGIAFAQGWVP